MKAKHYRQTAIKYAQDVIDGTIIAGADIVNACKRFLSDLEREDLEYRDKEPDACITLMEGMFVHRKGEMLDGTPLLGKPLSWNRGRCLLYAICSAFGIKARRSGVIKSL